MCRWAAYIGSSIFIEGVVTRPEHSLISQSVCASEAKTETNGDEVGWRGTASILNPAFIAKHTPHGLIPIL